MSKNAIGLSVLAVLLLVLLFQLPSAVEESREPAWLLAVVPYGVALALCIRAKIRK